MQRVVRFVQKILAKFQVLIVNDIDVFHTNLIQRFDNFFAAMTIFLEAIQQSLRNGVFFAVELIDVHDDEKTIIFETASKNGESLYEFLKLNITRRA